MRLHTRSDQACLVRLGKSGARVADAHAGEPFHWKRFGKGEIRHLQRRLCLRDDGAGGRDDGDGGRDDRAGNVIAYILLRGSA